MKKLNFLLVVVPLLLSACTPATNQPTAVKRTEPQEFGATALSVQHLLRIGQVWRVTTAGDTNPSVLVYVNTVAGPNRGTFSTSQTTLNSLVEGNMTPFLSYDRARYTLTAMWSQEGRIRLCRVTNASEASLSFEGVAVLAGGQDSKCTIELISGSGG